MLWEIVLVAAVWGTMMGSVANALIDRLPREESWTKGRSKCDKCKHVLGLGDLIPVWSYVFLGGKCRYCHSPISPRNLLVELFMGFGFGVIWGWLGWGWAGVILSLILVVTVVIAVMDWETKLVSELMVGIWAGLVLVLNILELGSGDRWLGLGVGLAVIGGVWWGSKGKAMGAGDVEIALVMGWWLGWQKMLVALWIAFVAGAVVGVSEMFFKRKKLKSEIAFGPYLIVGTWIALFTGAWWWQLFGLPYSG